MSAVLAALLLTGAWSPIPRAASPPTSDPASSSAPQGPTLGAAGATLNPSGPQGTEAAPQPKEDDPSSPPEASSETPESTAPLVIPEGAFSRQPPPGSTSPPAPADAESQEVLQPAAKHDDQAVNFNGRRRVWAKTWVSVAIIGGEHHFGLGAGVVRFFSPYVGAGFDVEAIAVLLEPQYGAFTFTPHLVLLALPYRRVTPVMRAGLGLAAFTGGGGSYARWITGLGVAAALGRHFTLHLGVDVSAMAPDSKFQTRFVCPTDQRICSFQIGPTVGGGWQF